MSYSTYLYARLVNEGTDDEYMMTGTEPGDVDASNIASHEVVSPKVARYTLVGMGEIHNTAPVYVED